MYLWCHGCGRSFEGEMGPCPHCAGEAVEDVSGSIAPANFIPYVVPRRIVPDLTIRLRIYTFVQEDEPGVRRVSAKTIEELRRVTRAVSCSVCQAEEEQARVVQLPCGHAFHQGCIVPWLESSCQCPSCRQEVT